MKSKLKKLAFAAMLLSGLAAKAHAVTVNSCPAGSVICSIVLTSADWIMVTDNSIWPEGTNAAPAEYKLNLADTNPTFFSFVYNTVKDWKVNNSAKAIKIWYYPVGSNGATYKKIMQVGVQ